MDICTREIEKKIQKNMYICININSRVTELYHTLRSIKDNQRLLRVKIQNEKDTQRSLTQKSDQKQRLSVVTP